jgi:ribose/xylose/arabinose/galactoside ABC-type transport system permease subunit
MSTADSVWQSLPRPNASWTRLGFPVALVVLLVWGAIAYPAFGTVANFKILAAFSVVPFIIAIGQTFVIVGRGVDLSVGSMAGLSGAIFAELSAHGQPGYEAMGITLLIASAYGLVQGLIITKLKVSFFIVTLAGFSILRSQASVILNGQSVTIASPFLDALSNGTLAGIPVIILLAVLAFAIALIVLRATVYGRSLYATGSNPQAALLAGIPTDRITTIAFVVSAFAAGLGGVLLAGQLGSSEPSAATGLELTSIAAVLLGGTRFSGGHGGVGGTLLGIVFLQCLSNLLLIAGVDSFWLGTASGVVLVIAVAIDRTRKD